MTPSAESMGISLIIGTIALAIALVIIDIYFKNRLNKYLEWARRFYGGMPHVEIKEDEKK